MIITEVGHVKLNEEMYDEDFRLAWGTLPSGSEWGDTPDPEDISATELIQEVGRIKSEIKEYVYPDENGVIEVENVKWAISSTPTKYLYLKFQFDQTQNSNDVIYQLGLFTDTIPSTGYEAEDYLQPSQITDFGKILLIENQPVLYRNSASKEVYEYVITF